MLAHLLAAAFTLNSPDVTGGRPIRTAQVWNRDGCTGRNVAPVLRWSGAPHGTKSFALIAFDPDAPGRGWYHWIAYDIPARARSLDSSRMLRGMRQGRNDFGTVGYGGPCPPPGPAHHYVFTLYALRVARLPVPATPTGARATDALRGNVIAKATLTGIYQR